MRAIPLFGRSFSSDRLVLNFGEVSLNTRTRPMRKTLAEKLVFFMNLPVAPFYGMPPDKAAAIKILLYQLTAGWCKVGYSTPMNVKLSKTPPFTNPPNVVRNLPTYSHGKN
jgi:hypothetical protein